MQLLLICHAEGMQDRYSDLGARNGGLTALGWEQSDALADWLRTHRQLDFLVTDSLLQSRLTAQRIGQAMGLSVTVNRDIPSYPRELFAKADAGKPAWQLSALSRTEHSEANIQTELYDGENFDVDEADVDETDVDEAGVDVVEGDIVDAGREHRDSNASESNEVQQNHSGHDGADAELTTAAGDKATREDGDQSPGSRYLVYLQSLIDVLDGLLAENWGKSVVLIAGRRTIGAVLQYVLCASGGASISSFERSAARLLQYNCLQIEHTGISELVFRPQGANAGWRIEYVNRMQHLPEPALPELDDRSAARPNLEVMEDLSTVIQVYDRNSKILEDDKRESDLKRIHHLINFAKLPADQHILDIGTGLGLLPLVLAEEGAHTVVGIDVSPGMLEQAEYYRLRSAAQAGERVSYRLAAAQSLPFHDARFDAVFCRLLLNHVQNPELVVQEVVRVLQPGGIFILAELLSVDNSVKRATQNAIEERRNPAHVAARSAEQYAKMLEDAGLAIENDETVSFEREMEEWLSTFDVDRADRAIVREMIEASVETDAAGINARRKGDTIVFEQRLYYLRAIKPLPDDD